jgi:hypothetical protein
MGSEDRYRLEIALFPQSPMGFVDVVTTSV